MSAKETARGAAQLVVELGPVAVFMVSYNVVRGLPAASALLSAFDAGPADAIYLATGLFMIATFVALGVSWLTSRTLPPILLIMGVLVLGFGGLTIAFRDPIYIKTMPTIVNGFYAIAIIASLLIGQNIWKLMFHHAFNLPDRIWTILAWRWAIFFLILAGLNEIVARTQSERFWVNFRFWGVFPLVFLFMLANLPITLKHIGKAERASHAS